MKLVNKLLNLTVIHLIALSYGSVMVQIKHIWLLVFIWNIFRITTLGILLKKIADSKKRISVKITPQDKLNLESIYNIFKISFLDLIVIYYSSYYNEPILVLNIFWLIPSLFGLEVVFDFFHYWSHRILHHPSLYFLHKYHHQDTSNLSSYSSYKHSFLDYLLTNVIPLVISSWIIPVTELNFMTFMFYKSYIEFSGHLGVFIKGTSFPEFIWLPRILGIELTSEDHYIHHVYYKKNYSKRFSLWDKVFGTYYQDLKIKEEKQIILYSDSEKQNKSSQISWKFKVLLIVTGGFTILTSYFYWGEGYF